MAELTFERVLELFAESDRRFEENLKKSKEAFTEELKESTEFWDKKMTQTNKEIAELGDTLGRFAEHQVKEDLVNKFNKYGLPVHSYTTNFVQRNEDGEFVYEVDILLYNTKYVVAIEVKNHLEKDDIDEHIQRMKKLQDYPLPDTKGKSLLAGVACMISAEGLDKYAAFKGLFFIKPSGENIKIINSKKSFKPRAWKVK